MIVLGYVFFGGDTDAHTAGVRLRDRMLAQMCGITQPQVVRTSTGKPILADRTDVHFSISHSGELAVCVLSVPGVGDAGEFLLLESSAAAPEVGADAEFIRPAAEAARLRKIAARFFPPEEALRIGTLSDEACPRVFCEVWTACESAVKMTGRGFGGGFSALTFDGLRMPMRTLRRGDTEYIVRAVWRADGEQEEWL